MVTLCDRCLEKGKQEYANKNVGTIFNEEDLCDKHYKKWLKENDRI